MQEAVITHPPKALGQHVLQNKFYKGVSLKGSSLTMAFIIVIGKGDLPITVADNVLLRDDAAIQVPRKILQSG